MALVYFNDNNISLLIFKTMAGGSKLFCGVSSLTFRISKRTLKWFSLLNHERCIQGLKVCRNNL